MSIPNLSLLSSSESSPKLWLTSMSNADHDSCVNAQEIIEPIKEWLDGVIWVVHDGCGLEPINNYLCKVQGKGKIIERDWSNGRHWVSMNETLYTGIIQENDYVIWTDALERPMPEFISKIKSKIGPLMERDDIDVLFYYGKPFLFRYKEILEYRNSPHWSLHGWTGKGTEWSHVEPNEKLVRFNMRPFKRKDPLNWVEHYAKYWMYPAGSNHALLGIEQHGGDLQQMFHQREMRRLAFRQEMKRRGYSTTIEDLKVMLMNPLDPILLEHLQAEKTLSDFWHLLHGNGERLKDTHKPSDALPIR